MKTYILQILLAFLLFNINVYSQNELKEIGSFVSEGEIVNISDKSISEAIDAMRIIKEAPIYLRTKKETANNCENRAQFAYLVLEKLGFNPMNYWILKEALIDDIPLKRSKGLSYDTEIGKKSRVYWGYHVATGITLQIDDVTTITYIFDPWTQKELVTLKKWGLSFFEEISGRTAYIFHTKGLYRFYGTKLNGKLSFDKSDWLRNLDNDFNQMFCGLSGITPNKKCTKKRFKSEILKKKNEIKAYLSKNNIQLD